MACPLVYTQTYAHVPPLSRSRFGTKQVEEAMYQPFHSFIHSFIHTFNKYSLFPPVCQDLANNSGLHFLPWRMHSLVEEATQWDRKQPISLSFEKFRLKQEIRSFQLPGTMSEKVSLMPCRWPCGRQQPC